MFSDWLIAQDTVNIKIINALDCVFFFMIVLPFRGLIGKCFCAILKVKEVGWVRFLAWMRGS